MTTKAAAVDDAAPQQQQQNQSLQENESNDEVMLMAERLAPELEKADHVFTVPTEFKRSESGIDGASRSIEDDDDDFGKEVQELEMAEELLRQELEQATDFSNLFASTLSPKQEALSESPLPPPPMEPHMPPVSEADMDATDQQSPEQNSLSLLSMRRRILAQQSPPRAATPKSTSSSVAAASPGPPSSNNMRTPPPPAMMTTPETRQHSGGSIESGTSTVDTCLLYVGNQPVPYHIVDHRHALRLDLEARAATATATATTATTSAGGAAASWYTVDLTQHVVTTSIRNSISSSPSWGVKEYCFSMSEGKLKNQYVGLPEPTRIPPKATTTTTPSPTTSRTSPSSTPPEPQVPAAPLPVRTLAMKIRPDVLCGAVMDAAHQGIGRSQQQVELNLPPPTASSSAENNSSSRHSYCSSTTQVLKRQGGHLRAIVTLAGAASSTTTTAISFLMDVQLCTYKSPDCDRRLLIRVYHCDGATTTTTTTNQDDANNNDTTDAITDDLATNQPFMVTSTTTEASLHLREACALIQRMDAVATTRSSASSSHYKLRPAQSPTLSDRDGMKETVSSHLLGQYKALPSVKEGNITLPALNSDDWAIIQASWPFIQAIWDELESRDLTYTTLLTPSARFGAFPALPTLDVHYCSQIRRYSRETMIVQLLRSASDMEEWAREAEYACANMISLLQPAFESYGIEAPPLPRPVPLTSYPLQFTPPQTACPPWGIKVMEALNEIQKWTGEANAAAASGQATLQASMPSTATEGSPPPPSPFLPSLMPQQSVDEEEAEKSVAMARKAVNLVWMAFQQQDDDEKGARLERKNVQVMDRLSKMQAHQRASIQAVERAGGSGERNTGGDGEEETGIVWSEKASKAADEFLAKSDGKAREVPLLKWSVVVGSSTGTCWVSQNYILFVTQLIPVIGGNTTRLFLLRDSEFVVEEEAPASLLNPLPTVIALHYTPRAQDGETSQEKEVYSFRPSVGGARLKSFLDSVKAVATEKPLLED